MQGSACLCVELNAVIVLCKKACVVNRIGSVQEKRGLLLEDSFIVPVILTCVESRFSLIPCPAQYPVLGRDLKEGRNLIFTFSSLSV